MSEVESGNTKLAKMQLKSIIERVEALEDKKKEYADEIKDVYTEAKGNGFDVEALKKIIAIRKQDPDKRAEKEAVLDAYLQALGML